MPQSKTAIDSSLADFPGRLAAQRRCTLQHKRSSRWQRCLSSTLVDRRTSSRSRTTIHTFSTGFDCCRFACGRRGVRVARSSPRPSRSLPLRKRRKHSEKSSFSPSVPASFRRTGMCRSGSCPTCGDACNGESSDARRLDVWNARRQRSRRCGRGRRLTSPAGASASRDSADGLTCQGRRTRITIPRASRELSGHPKLLTAPRSDGYQSSEGHGTSRRTSV